MIILRKEKFGGIAFNNKNAHELWLDEELFLKLEKSLKEKDKINEDLKKTYKKLGVKNNKNNFKVVKNKTDIKTSYDFPVLSAPTLIDVNITEKCNLNCPHCYINSSKDGKHMSLENFRIILNECKKNGVLQIALGGGEPTLHPNFGSMLKETRKAGIIPNLTSNGKYLNWKSIYYMARYAGAVALSIEELDSDFKKRRGFSIKEFEKSIKKLKASRINLVFQITLGRNNLSKIDDLTKYLLQFKPYGIIFLAYKPQGRGLNYDQPIALANPDKIETTLESIFQNLKGKTKIGFDCCLTPAIVKFKNNSALVGCTASRGSLAIMPDLTVMPCSFLNKNQEFDSLKNKLLKEVWLGKNFENFRSKIQNQLNQKQCLSCKHKTTCLGGCPEFELVRC